MPHSPATPPRTDEPVPSGARIGLVLGGGGASGVAFHAGALATLEHDLGWDPRAAEVIVGTSAGALVGGLLRLGVAAEDLAAIAVGAPARRTRADLVARLVDRPDIAPWRPVDLLRRPPLPNPALAWGLVTAAARRGAGALAALPLLAGDGREDLLPHLRFVDDALDGPWPDGALLACAARRSDGRRVVFGADVVPATLSSAIAASCAVPGYFRPVRVEGTDYVDGGVVSATNADVLRGRNVDLAIVVSPMTGPVQDLSAVAALRILCRRNLAAELRALHRAGIPSVVVQPDAASGRLMRLDVTDATRSADIVTAAFLGVGRQLADEPLLAGLGDRARRRAAARRVDRW